MRLLLAVTLSLLTWSPSMVRGQVDVPYDAPLRVAPGDTIHLESDPHPLGVCRLEWTSLHPAVAAVDGTGRLAALAPGATTVHVEAPEGRGPCRGAVAIHVRVVERSGVPDGATLDRALARRERGAILVRALRAACGDRFRGGVPILLDPRPLHGPSAGRRPERWLERAVAETCAVDVAGRDEPIDRPAYLRASLSDPRFLYGGDVEVEYVLSGILRPDARSGFRTSSFVRLARVEDRWEVVEVRLESVT